jgi:uncharacterized membrane protein YfcA
MDPVTATLLILAIPIGILIGVGAGIVGLTAWPLLVPVFFVFGGVSLHESLLSSLLVDLVIAVILSVFYVRQPEVKIDTNLGVKLGIVISVFSFLTLVAVFSLLEQYSGIFKSGSTLVTLLLGCVFLIQGIRMNQGSRSKRLQDSPEDSSRFSANNRQQMIAYGFCIGQGVLTGVLAIGGAMNIVIILAFVLGFPLLRAVGTAMVSTAITMAVIVSTYLFLLGFTVTILHVTLAYMIIAGASCYVAVTRIQNTSEKKLRLLIGSVVIFAAVIAMIQVYLIR